MPTFQNFDPFGYYAMTTSLDRLSAQLQAFQTLMVKKMSAISDAVAALAAQAQKTEDTEDAALLVLNGLKQQLSSALANASDATAAVANVQQVIAAMGTHNDPLATAIATPPSTPAGP